jgi:hypothetical protein
MKDKYSLYIHTDTSEETYEYILRKNGEDFLMGDGYETMEEIKEWLKELRDILNGVDLTIDEKS